jgi:pyrroloquinoline quinone biosynthesis protein B
MTRHTSRTGHEQDTEPVAVESMALWADFTDEEGSRMIFIHMNHTNPLLIDGSPEQAEVDKRGFRFGRERMRLEL